MEFRNEIIPEGGIDESGHQKVGNAERSVHAGVEFDGACELFGNLSLSGNGTYNFNRLKKYTIYPDYDWDGIVNDTLDYSNNIIANFPEYLANLILDYKTDRYRFTYRLRSVGKQYLDNGETEALAIDPYLVSSLSAALYLGDVENFGKFTLSGRIDNLFNKKYETSGYSYWWGESPYGEYYVGAERSFFVQLKWELQ
jgi:iron complex outermembrane receptor protein